MLRAWEPLTGDAVEHRDHKHETLAGGVACGRGTRLKGSVNRADGSRLGLHFDKPHRLTEHVFSALGAPSVGTPRHGRRGSNGVYSGDFGKLVSNVGGGAVAVDGHKVFGQLYLLNFREGNREKGIGNSPEQLSVVSCQLSAERCLPTAND